MLKLGSFRRLESNVTDMLCPRQHLQVPMCKHSKTVLVSRLFSQERCFYQGIETFSIHSSFHRAVMGFAAKNHRHKSQTMLFLIMYQ